MRYPSIARLFFGNMGYVLFVWLIILIIAVIMVNKDVMRPKLWMSFILGGVCAFITTIYSIAVPLQIVVFIAVSGVTYVIAKYREKR